jgi:DNA-binding XRE family transcriptional regulator
VRRVRRRIGLSQVASARRIGVPVDTVRNWEQASARSKDPPCLTIASWITFRSGRAQHGRARLRARPEVATMAEGGGGRRHEADAIEQMEFASPDDDQRSEWRENYIRECMDRKGFEEPSTI